jgi:hypothetical protein
MVKMMVCPKCGTPIEIVCKECKFVMVISPMSEYDRDSVLTGYGVSESISRKQIEYNKTTKRLD